MGIKFAKLKLDEHIHCISFCLSHMTINESTGYNKEEIQRFHAIRKSVYDVHKLVSEINISVSRLAQQQFQCINKMLPDILYSISTLNIHESNNINMENREKSLRILKKMSKIVIEYAEENYLMHNCF